MRSETNSQLYIPQGAESLHLDEAYTHRAVLRRIEDIYHNWGYLPVQTPVIDYFEHYRSYLDPKSNEGIYRLIDREGELLMLRSDITLFLARLMSMNLKEDSLPVRAYYGDTILRYQAKEDISHNEFFQVGCELVGKEGLEGDLEILLLLKDQLDQLELKGYRIHLGSRALFNKLSNALKAPTQKILAQAILDRDSLKIQQCLEEHFDEVTSKEICQLFMFLGTYEELKDFISKRSQGLQDLISTEIQHLLQIASTLGELQQIDQFRMDLSEIGLQPYYSGIVFQCYAPGSDSAIASGGRYDGLISCKQKPQSSVGYSMMLRKIEALLPAIEIPIPYRVKEDPSFIQRYTKAQSLRAKGRSVLL